MGIRRTASASNRSGLRKRPALTPDFFRFSVFSFRPANILAKLLFSPACRSQHYGNNRFRGRLFGAQFNLFFLAPHPHYLSQAFLLLAALLAQLRIELLARP